MPSAKCSLKENPKGFQMYDDLIHNDVNSNYNELFFLIHKTSKSPAPQLHCKVGGT